MSTTRIAIDLTPVLPGGENGGAKWLTIDLLRQFADDPSLEQICFVRQPAFSEIRAFLPDKIIVLALDVDDSIDAAFRAADDKYAFDICFFPFTHVSYTPKTAAIVAIVHDIQFKDLPRNFNPMELIERNAAVGTVARYSHRIVVVSEFVKRSLMRHFGLDEDRIDVIYNLRRSGGDQNKDARRDQKFLASYGIKSKQYILYPANYWEHKNHRILLAAYAHYMRRTESPAQLVLTGDPKAPCAQEIAALSKYISGENIKILGFIPPEALDCLYRHAAAMIFPSLYEGFGMPLIEAMDAKCPIAASWATCIPEICGGAAVLFDPAKPREIADAISQVVSDEDVRGRLLGRAQERLAELGDIRRLAQSYRTSFLRAIEDSKHAPKVDRLLGVYSDGWIGDELLLTVAAANGPQRVQAVLRGPPASSRGRTALSIHASNSNEPTTFYLEPETTYRLAVDLPEEGGNVALRAATWFQPSEIYGSEDMRRLTFKVCKLSIDRGGQATWLYGGGDADLVGPALYCAYVEGGSDGKTVHVARTTGSLPAGTLFIEGIDPTTATDTLADGQPLQDGETTEAEVTSLKPLDVLTLIGKRVDRELNVRSAAGSIHAVTMLRERSFAPPPQLPETDEVPGLFSIVVPSYNQGRFIGRTLESALSQSHIADAHVFDGGSSDDTKDQVARFDRVEFVSEKDRGQADAINKGLRAGRGEYIAWINSDDTYCSGAFDTVRAAFERHPDVDVIYGDAFHIDENDLIIDRYPTEDPRLSRLWETCYICQPAAFIRRRALRRFGGLREDLQYCMDYELWLRLAVNGCRFLRVGSFLANSRLYATNKTLGARLAVHHEITQMFRACFDTESQRWRANLAHVIANDASRLGGVDASAAQLRDIQHILAAFSNIYDQRLAAQTFVNRGLA